MTRTSVMTALLGGMIFILPLTAKGQAEIEAQRYRFDVNMTLLDVGIRKVPFSVRNVPPHPDDLALSGYTTPGAINKTRLDNTVSVSLGATLSKTRWMQANVSARIRWWVYPNSAFFTPGMGIAERNYTNAPDTAQRGYGAALTYMGLETRGLFPAIRALKGFNLLTNISPEVRLDWPVRIGKSRQRISLTVSYFSLDVLTGYDRFDHLEERERHPLAYCLPLTVGLETGAFQIGARMTLAFGQGVDVLTPSLTLGWSF